MKKAELEKVVNEFKRLKLAQAELESRLAPLKEAIEKVVAKTPDHSMIVGLHKVTLVDQTREVFQLKDAKLVLGNKLTPFIKPITYTSLRVS